LTTVISRFDHAETLRRLTTAAEARRLTVFAEIDHAAGGVAAGLPLEPLDVVFVGNPKAGTLLMQADLMVGIELPLKLLVFSRGDQVSVAYRDPHELAEQYAVGQQGAVLDAMAALLGALAAAAAGTATA
jgi:uncharacterized protein (DUF302 family)